MCLPEEGFRVSDRNAGRRTRCLPGRKVGGSYNDVSVDAVWLASRRGLVSFDTFLIEKVTLLTEKPETARNPCGCRATFL